MDSCPKNIRHFFKIILDDTIRDGKLGIPRKFVRRYGNDLTSPVVLKVPSGAEWQVELVKHDDEIWLQNGWQEFLNYYSLVHGSFIVFKYNLTTKDFNVIVFDKTASEIDYPFDLIHGVKEEEGNDSVEILKVSQRHSCSKIPEAADKFTSANAFFKVKIRSHFFKNRNLSVPKRFVANFTNRSTKNVVLQVGRKQWPVKLIKFNSQYKLSAGLALFAKENSLGVGDVCIFELINNDIVLLKVSIFKNVK